MHNIAALSYNALSASQTSTETTVRLQCNSIKLIEATIPGASFVTHETKHVSADARIRPTYRMHSLGIILVILLFNFLIRIVQINTQHRLLVVLQKMIAGFDITSGSLQRSHGGIVVESRALRSTPRA